MILLAFCAFPSFQAQAQTTPVDTSRIGKILDGLLKPVRDSLEYQRYRKSGIQATKTALDTAILYRTWMPTRYADALEFRAVTLFYYENRQDSATVMFDTLISLREKYQKGTSQHAIALYQKARAYFYIKNYPKTDSLILLALDMLRNNKDTQSVRYAKVMNGYGQLLINTQKPAEGEKYYQDAIDLITRIGQPIQRAKMLVDLAEARVRMGKTQEAISSFTKARESFASMVPNADTAAFDPMYFGAGINLAKLYLDRLRQPAPARAYYDEVLRWYPDTVSNVFTGALNGKAGLCFQLKQLDEARQLYKRVLAIDTKLYKSDKHPSFRKDEFRLAKLEYAARSPLQALEIIRRNLPVYDAELFKTSEYYSESELLAYQASFADEFYVACSFALDNPSDQMAKLLYNHALTTKTAIMDNTLLVRKAMAKDTMASKHLWNEWIDLKKSVEKAINSGDPTADLENHISQLEKKMNALKGNIFFRWPINSDSLEKVLKKDEVAIEFLAFYYRNPYLTDSLFYIALVMKKDYTSPKMIKLFERKELDEVFKMLVDTIPSTYTQFYAGLDKLLWTNKLAPLIKPGDRVYYSMDGDLVRINPAAITVGTTGRSLSTYCKWFDVNSTRDIYISRKSPEQTPVYPMADDYALIYGGVDYGINADLFKKNRPEPGWSYLPGTQKQAFFLDSICRKLHIKHTALLGPSATELSLKQAGAGSTFKQNSPWLLHFGTHGFYWPKPKEKKQPNSAPEPFFIRQNNPMWRVGLKLANAYPNWYGKTDTLIKEDGILFAYETTSLDLSRTYLTVLSACETGRGENQGFEGLFGLRRGFRIAGSKYLMLNLWRSDDLATTEFMQRFYTHLLENREEIHDAFENARNEFKQQYTQPYYWANFILVGPPASY